MTPFQKAVEAVKNGTLKTPHTSVGNKQVDYFLFQLTSHYFYMKLFARGMTARGVKLKDYKTYYGLKGKSAKECLPEFEKIMNDYKQSIGAN